MVLSNSSRPSEKKIAAFRLRIFKTQNVLDLVLLANFLFCHPYVTMPNVSLNFRIKYDQLPASKVLKYLL